MSSRGPERGGLSSLALATEQCSPAASQLGTKAGFPRTVLPAVLSILLPLSALSPEAGERRGETHREDGRTIHEPARPCSWRKIPDSVFGDHTDDVKSVSVMEGDSVTLNTDVTDINHILWTFKQNSETCIAKIYNQNIFIYDAGENERFRGRLQIDEQTGSLTITNTNKLHSGLYKVRIISGDIKYESFSIAVYGILTVPLISDSPQKLSVSGRTSQNCSLLCSVVNVSDVTLSWYKGNSLLSNISVSDLSISLSLPLKIECLDDSYSCVVAYSFTNRTKHLNNTELCQTCSGTSVFIHLLIVLCWFFSK
ncbi:uncharacterized protein [Garra rufa]|uniref:uncharacterized protein n=1 Tax=Garra rufa TaxID=137080 RepID=UPI003CCE6EBF